MTLCRKIIVVCSENRTKCINMFCVRSVKTVGTYGSRHGLKCWSICVHLSGMGNVIKTYPGYNLIFCSRWRRWIEPQSKCTVDLFSPNSVLPATNNYHSEPERGSQGHSSISYNPSGFPWGFRLLLLLFSHIRSSLYFFDFPSHFVKRHDLAIVRNEEFLQNKKECRDAVLLYVRHHFLVRRRSIDICT